MSTPTRPRARVVAPALLALGLSWAAPALAVMTHDYEFNGNLNDSLGGPSLVGLGGTIGATSYTFGAQQGLSLSSALTTASTYTIDLSFEFDNLGGFRKILDFKNRASDNGLYNLNTALNYFNVTTGSTGAFTAGSFVRVDLTRDNSTGLVVGYVNGAQAISFTDSTGDATFTAANNLINFFIDDNATGGGESSPGSVNQIRIWDNALSASAVAALGGPKGAAVPEPSGLALAATGLALAGLGGRRLARRA